MQILIRIILILFNQEYSIKFLFQQWSTQAILFISALNFISPETPFFGFNFMDLLKRVSSHCTDNRKLIVFWLLKDKFLFFLALLSQIYSFNILIFYYILALLLINNLFLSLLSFLQLKYFLLRILPFKVKRFL